MLSCSESGKVNTIVALNNKYHINVKNAVNKNRLASPDNYHIKNTNMHTKKRVSERMHVL